MRRADRLFRIVQLLRSGRLLTAQKLAEKLEVSTRSIYRDIRELQLSGTPVEGEAGVGYTLRRDFDLPPLMFTRQELTALVLGARLVQALGGAESAAAAHSALGRIEAVLSTEMRERLDSILFFAPDFYIPKNVRERLDVIHEACIQRHPLRFDYVREDGHATRARTVRPLALYCWRSAWTVATWCELRHGFRVFRIDRMERFEVMPETFEHRRGQRLEDYLLTVTEPPKDA
ncbi:HTH domain-containing protein [Granulicella rosea]|uniref:HTH domain-containing protein n=1 Tax=Granulicella rosea TaxID=474952 RepID=A0A239LR31_9BACT|nr:YafY family protein [Granulicella rosea]SNT32084.1 HTH domain-containing protein [Granulicella rosea]